MKTQTLRFVLVLGLLLAFAQGCEFNMSTANLSSLKLGKDKSVTQETTTFAATDTIYAVATVSNAPGNVTVKGHLVADDVPGEKNGPIPGTEVTQQLAGSGTVTFTYTGPNGGWPKGKYTLDVVMLDEGGQQKDEKKATFTVS